MIYSIFTTKDATLSEKYPEMNTGIDEVLTVEKISSSSVSPITYNSRTVLKFDIDWTKISGSWNNAYLNMYVTEEKNVGADYILVVNAVSESWDMGLGREGHSPKTNVGVSYKYRNKTQLWSTLGGTTHSGASVGEQSFSDQDKDLRINVSSSLTAWSSSAQGEDGFLHYPNDGFMVKRTGSQETDAFSYGSIQFFGQKTHTIYQPRLEICWVDKVWNAGSLSALSMAEPDENFFYIKSNRGEYTKGSKIRLSVRGRQRYPAKTHAIKSAELSILYAPENTITYAIIDAKTGEAIIPHDSIYTALSCHATKGNFFEFYSDSLSEERFYTVQLKYSSGTDLAYYNLKETFRVVR